MKKLFFLWFFLIESLFALPVCNPSDPSILCYGVIIPTAAYKCPSDRFCFVVEDFSFRPGFIGSYVYDRNMQLVPVENRRKVDRVQIYTNSGFIAFNIADSFEFFTTLGTGNFKITANDEVFSGPNSIVTIRSESDFAWSVGIRWAMFRRKCLAFGIEIEVAGIQTPLESITLGDLATIYPRNVNAKYSDWQIAAGFSYHLFHLIPYASVTYSRSKIHFTQEVTTLTPLFDIIERFSWGYALGVTIPSGKRTSVTIEGRFRDESALNVVAEIRF